MGILGIWITLDHNDQSFQWKVTWFQSWEECSQIGQVITVQLALFEEVRVLTLILHSCLLLGNGDFYGHHTIKIC